MTNKQDARYYELRERLRGCKMMIADLRSEMKGAKQFVRQCEADGVKNLTKIVLRDLDRTKLYLANDEKLLAALIRDRDKLQDQIDKFKG